MAKKESNKKDEVKPLVVALGASAGGLEALKSFFLSLPKKPGMSFIVVIHLSPEKKSNMAGLLQSKTELKVEQISKRTPIKPNHVYIIPPNNLLSVKNNHLILSDFEKKPGLHTINQLFQTLAESKKEQAVGIILSGSGMDGSEGLKAIKKHNGLVLVQEPEEAKNTGMPQSAIRTGDMDMVLSVKEMPGELLRYQKTYSKKSPSDVDDDQEEILTKIFEKIRLKLGHDFSNYRRSSVLRRIDRRVRMVHAYSLSQYLEYLEKNPEEVEELFKDMLIGVTSFFRDTESFEKLQQEIIPKLFEEKNKTDYIRVWVPGCATGEEAYSIAMLLIEHASNTTNYPQIQIFASDVDEESLRKAREGRYSKEIEDVVSEERLDQFFTRHEDDYIVKKKLRDLILFASHDLLSNAPFSNQDLIVCRNLLIYLNKDLQSEVFNLFYYSLKDSGYLFLGRSDSHIGTEGLFRTVDRKHHIYQQKPTARTQVKLPNLPLLHSSRTSSKRRDTPRQRKKRIETMHWRILSRIYAPQSVLIDEDYNVLHATEGIGKYMKASVWEPTQNILEMVEPSIRQALRSILFQFKEEEEIPTQKKVQVSLNEETKLEIVVSSVTDSKYHENLINVVLKETKGISPQLPDTDKDKEEMEEGDIIEALEKELEYTKDQLRVSIEEYETSNEDLRSSNEELQSMNEELQSTTEELETSQEELQSVNEELQTVNEELENKVEQLSRAHSDLENLMEATEVAILFIDKQFRIQRFTDTTRELFNVIDTDLGRPLFDITNCLKYDDLKNNINTVLQGGEMIKQQISTDEDRWFIMRIRPYTSNKNNVAGVVLTFTEITELRQYEKNLERKARQEEALARLGLYALDGKENENVVHRCIQVSCEILNLDFCMLYEFQTESDYFHLIESAGEGFKGDCPKDLDVTVKENKTWDIGYIFENEKSEVVEDYKTEEKFTVPPYLNDYQISSGIHVLVELTDNIFGVLSAYSKTPRKFTEDDMNFLQVVANLIGETIDRNRAHSQLEKTNRQLKEAIKKSELYQKEILDNSVAERWELGSYLHDNLAQSLATAKILVNDLNNYLKKENESSSNEIQELNNIIDQGIENIRNLTHDIIPIDIEDDGIIQTFQFLTERTEKLYDINCRVEAEEISDNVNDRKLATHLYHIVQESIKNSVVHGKAKNILIIIKQNDQELILEVKDDGTGLDESSKDSKSHGKGLRIMKHRMELLGGTFKIQEWQEEGESGTEIICFIPKERLKEKASHQ